MLLPASRKLRKLRYDLMGEFAREAKVVVFLRSTQTLYREIDELFGGIGILQIPYRCSKNFQRYELKIS